MKRINIIIKIILKITEIKNREQLKLIRQNYYIENKERIDKRNKDYRKNNIEKVNDYHKNYNEVNKEIIHIKRIERVNCNFCNKELCRSSLSRHIKKYHLTY